MYEPGSTFKLVTIAAALEEKLTRPDEVFDCQMGSIVINGMRIRDSKPHGLLSVAGILAESSDVGAIKIALRLGEERFYKYIRAFGFGQQTGIEVPGETRGLTKPLNRWSKVSIGAISMGQEIGVTPLQLVAMVSTIANDGVWVAPRIVAGTTEPQGAPQMVAFHPAVQRRVISPMTAAQMKQMMQGVVLHGTGKKAILEGYSSAGKTGTAQKVDPATHTYSHTKYVGSFAGFAPVNDPAITVAVILDSAVGLHQGGQVSAPVFQRVAQQVLEYLHTPHDVELPPSRQVLMASAVCSPCSAARANFDGRRQSAGSDTIFGSSTIQRHDHVGRRAGRDCGPIVSGQERQKRDRNGPGKRTGSRCGWQRSGSPAVAPARIPRSIRIAGDGEVWAVKEVAAGRSNGNI